MLDIRFIRENPDVVKENIRKKYISDWYKELYDYMVQFQGEIQQ